MTDIRWFMNADRFVEKLKSIAPSPEKMQSCGYLQEIIAEYRKSYFLERKTPEIPRIDDPLEHLICNYDTSKFELGVLTLGKEEFYYTPIHSKVRVGAIEADILVIDENSGEVELLDHSWPNRVIAKCAASGEQFLEAILLLARYEPPYENVKDGLTKAQKEKNKKAALKHAAKCAKIAGISGPPNIYETLLGCE